MISRRIRFLIVLGCMTLFLLGMAGYHSYVRMTGRTVVLKTEPVDPRSLFRGDYIRLSYTINEVPCDSDELDKTAETSSKVFVTLKQKNKYWTAQHLSSQYPTNVQKQRVVISGKLEHDIREGTCQVNYPSIQTYFVPEDRGKRLEELRGQGLKVEVSIGGSGYPVINRLIMPNNQPQ
ncbi:MAG: GDYXXLXY domain-containing protein [bacterium]